MKTKSLIFGVMGVLLAISVMGCDDSDSSSKYMLSDSVPDVVLMPVTNNVGTFQFDVSDADTSTEAMDAFGMYLADGTISMTITNVATSVSYNLTQGTLVAGAPAAPGEYSYSITADQAVVSFYNEFDGKMLHSTSEYYTTTTVLENPYFETESFTTNVGVQ